MKSEIQRRQSKTDAVIALFRSQPLAWIGIHQLAHVGGFAARRTRISNARAILEKIYAANDPDGGTIVWNNDVHDSAYMFVPWKPIARSAETTVTGQRELFPPQNFAT